MGIVLASLSVLWVLRCYLRGRVEYWKSWVHVGLLVLIVLTALQILPLGDYVSTLSATTAQRWGEAQDAGAEAASYTLSLVPTATSDCLFLILMALAIYFITAGVCTTRRSFIGIALAIAASGTINAVIGIVEAFMGGKKYYWYLGHSYTNAVTGTFLNKNHFALLVEMSALTAVGLALAVIFSRRRRTQGEAPDINLLRKHHLSFSTITMLSLMVMIVALLFSFSRAGTFCALAGIAILGVSAVRAAGKTWRLSGLIGAGAGAFLIASGRGLERVWQRFETLISGEGMSMSARWDFWKSSIVLLRNHWLYGVGFGGYKYSGPRHETGFIPDRIAMHVHNDWLEFLCEFGAPAGAALLILLIGILAVTGVRLYRCRDPIAKWIGAGALLAVISVGVHEFFDYGLRMPGNMLVCMGTLALAVVCSHATEINKRTRSSPALRSIKLGTVSGPIFLAAGIGVSIAFTAAILPRTLAGFPLSRLEARTGPQAPPSMMKPRDEAQYRIELSEEILRYLPDDPRALMQRAENEAILGVAELKQALAGMLSDDLNTEVLDEDLDDPELQPLKRAAMTRLDPFVRERIMHRFSRAVEDLRRACGVVPTNGHYLALYGRAMERVGIFRGDVDENAVKRAYDLAGESYPVVGRVTTLCADAAWRRYLRVRKDVDLAERKRILEDAVLLFRKAVEQDPKNAKHAYTTVWPFVPKSEVLRALTPNRIVCHEALYQFLFDQRDLDGCLRQLDIIDGLNKSRVPIEKVEESDLYTIIRRDGRSNEQITLSVQKRKIVLMGLMNRWYERAENLSSLRAALRDTLEDKLALAEGLLAQRELHRARIHLEKILEIEPFHPQAILLQAKVLKHLGYTDDAVRVLLRLVYTDHYVESDVVSEALTLVGESTRILDIPLLSWEVPPFPVWRFLRAGLLLKLGREEEGLEELNALLDMMRRKEVSRFIQTPMIHYSAGRALENLGRPTEALRAYARALTLCPAHLPSARNSERLMKELKVYNALPEIEGEGNDRLFQTLEEAKQWLATVQPAVPVDADFGGKMKLLGYTVTPQRISPGGFVRVTFYWYCQADIEREYTIGCHYYRDGQRMFSDTHRIRGVGFDMVGWRVGEVVTVTRDVSPTSLSAKQRRRRVQPGLYDLHVAPYAATARTHQLKPLVTCRAPAFEVVPKKENKLD